MHFQYLMVDLAVLTQSSGNKMLILDLRHVNHFIWKGDYLFSLDVKSGYPHIEIFPNHQTSGFLLGLFWYRSIFSFVLHHFT